MRQWSQLNAAHLKMLKMSEKKKERKVEREREKATVRNGKIEKERNERELLYIFPVRQFRSFTIHAV